MKKYWMNLFFKTPKLAKDHNKITKSIIILLR